MGYGVGRSVVLKAALIMLVGSVGCESTPRAAEDEVARGAADPRTPVMLPIDAQQAVLREMRAMLVAIGRALSAAARGDTGAVLAALAPAGGAAAADPALEALLPASWKELAERTHGGVDSLVAAVRRGPGGPGLKDTVLLGVARVMESCAACHETFRIAVR